MYSSVYAHITKAGYDLIAQKLAGQIENFEITAVSFSGGVSIHSLTPYEPSVYDTSLPNEVFRIPKDKLVTFVDPDDKCVVIRVRVNRNDLNGDYFINAIGVIANDNVLFASNSVSLVKVDTANELIFDIKLPFLSDNLMQLVSKKPPSPELPVFCLIPFEDTRNMVLLKAGYSGEIFRVNLKTYCVYAYFEMTLESANDFNIDYVALSLTNTDYDATVLFSNFSLDKNAFPKLSVKIPMPFKDFKVVVKKHSYDVVYSIKLYGLRFK